MFGDTDKVIPKGVCNSTGDKSNGKEILQYLIFYQLRHKADFMLLEHVFVFAQNHKLDMCMSHQTEYHP